MAYIRAMGTAIMLACILGLLAFWDLRLKLYATISRRMVRRHLDRVVSNMARLLLALAKQYGGLQVRIDPRLYYDVPRHALVCSNHQSVADIVVLMAALRNHSLRFIAKAELGHGFPAVSEVLRLQQHALIERRGNYRETARKLERLGERTQSGITPVIFPEGTRSRDGRVRPFHTGGVRTILQRASVPIVAVAIDGGHRFVAVSNIAAGLKEYTYQAKLIGVFEHGGDKTSIQAAVDATHDAIAQQVARWQEDDV